MQLYPSSNQILIPTPYLFDPPRAWGDLKQKVRLISWGGWEGRVGGARLFVGLVLKVGAQGMHVFGLHSPMMTLVKIIIELIFIDKSSRLPRNIWS